MRFSIMEFWDKHCRQFLMQLDRSASAKIEYAEIHGLSYKEFANNIAKFIETNGLPEKNKLFEALDKPLISSESDLSDQNINSVLFNFRQIRESMTVTPKVSPRLVVKRKIYRKEKSDRAQARRSRKQLADNYDPVLSTDTEKPKKEKKKIDYIKHCKKFLSGADISTSAAKIYVERRGIKYSTFRRHLRNYIKSEAYTKRLSQKSILRVLAKRKSRIDVDKNGGNNTDVYQSDDGLYTFVKGNSAAEIHSLYSKITSRIKSITKNINCIPDENILGIRSELRQHAEHLSEMYTDYMAIIENDYSVCKPIILQKRIDSKAVNYNVSKSDVTKEVNNKLTPQISRLKVLKKQLDTRIADLEAEVRSVF